jgi:anti-sigma regulatory factor (Ser/Thr protein kinase)
MHRRAGKSLWLQVASPGGLCDRFLPGAAPKSDVAQTQLGSVHGRGIHVMKTLMDEVRFEEGGAVIPMRKGAGGAPKLLAKNAQENSTK